MDSIDEKEFGELRADIKWLKQEIQEIKTMIKEDMNNLEQRVEDLEKFRDKVKGATVVIGVLLSSTLLVYVIAHFLGG